MNNSSVYQRKDGRWCAQYKDADGKTRYLYRKSKALVKQALKEALRQADEGIVPSKLTIKDILITWLEESGGEISARTLDNRQSLIRVHFFQHPIANTKLADLTHDHIRAYMNSKDHLAASTRKKLLAFLKYVGAESMRLRITRYNPVANYKPKKQAQRDLDVLKPKQIHKLLETVKDDRLELVFVFGATCGLRVGEALALRYEDFDIGAGTVSIRRTVWRSKVYPPKTEKSRRTIKLPKIALEALRRHGIKESGYLFPTKHGNPVAPSNFHKRNWKPALRKAGLPHSTRFHDLRHGTASLLLGQNVPIPVVSRFLGHSNPSITMKVYAHMIDGMGDIAAQGMDDALS